MMGNEGGELCFLGDGAVEDCRVRKTLEKNRPQYWEEILQHAYFFDK